MKYVVKDTTKSKFLTTRKVVYYEIIHNALITFKNRFNQKDLETFNKFEKELKNFKYLGNHFFYMQNYSTQTNYWSLEVPYNFGISKVEIETPSDELRNNLIILQRIAPLSKQIFAAAKKIINSIEKESESFQKEAGLINKILSFSAKPTLQKESSYKQKLQELQKIQKEINEKIQKSNYQFYSTEEYKNLSKQMREISANMPRPNDNDLLENYKQPFTLTKNKELLRLIDPDNWQIETFSEENDLYSSHGFAIIGPAHQKNKKDLKNNSGENEVRFANRNGEFSASIGGARLFETKNQAIQWAKIKQFKNYIVVKIKTELDSVVDETKTNDTLNLVSSFLSKKDIDFVLSPGTQVNDRRGKI